MMGTHTEQAALFSYEVNLDARVRSDHPLRAVLEHVDFTFVREAVADRYGTNGHVSVDPALVLKLLFLLFFDNVPSERALMRILPERLDYLWFLGYGLDDPIPNHSVLSKARARWGAEVFEHLFVRVVAQCVQAGLVSGATIHMDSTLVEANASKNSLVSGSPALVEALKQTLTGELSKLDEAAPVAATASAPPAPGPPAPVAPVAPADAPAPPALALWPAPAPRPAGTPKPSPPPRATVSTTDPDAGVVSRPGLAARARYKNHRAVDNACGIITACVTTSGTVDDGRLLPRLVRAHEATTGHAVAVCVADSHYGTLNNYRYLHPRGVRCHMADHGETGGQPSRGTVYPATAFVYDAASDTFQCPGGQTLRRHSDDPSTRRRTYQAPKGACDACPLRASCTQARTGRGRQVKRYHDQDLLDAARREARSAAARRDRIRRRHLMEGSFADGANRHGLKRSRWRGLLRQRVQDLMIATAQNVRRLVSRPRRRPTAVAGAARPGAPIGAGARRRTAPGPSWGPLERRGRRSGRPARHGASQTCLRRV